MNLKKISHGVSEKADLHDQNYYNYREINLWMTQTQFFKQQTFCKNCANCAILTKIKEEFFFAKLKLIVLQKWILLIVCQILFWSRKLKYGKKPSLINQLITKLFRSIKALPPARFSQSFFFQFKHDLK